jgi:hypothetical protein
MAIPRNRGTLERGAVHDVWRNTLSQIPSNFGRLIYLASLRSFDTGRYEHHGLSLIFGDAEADRALRRTHIEIFEKWKASNLQEQKADIDLYLSSLGESRKQVVESWAHVKPYANLVPATASAAEREHFRSDFVALLSLLKNVYGVITPDE